MSTEVLLSRASPRGLGARKTTRKSAHAVSVWFGERY